MSASCLELESWNTSSANYTFFKRKVNPSGKGSTVGFSSKQLGKKLTVSFPALTCYGISDFYDEASGTHDGKYKASVKIPKDSLLFQKIMEFQAMLVEQAAANSDDWFGKGPQGKKLDKGTIEFNCKFPLSYRKIQGTSDVDYDSDPYLKIKAPYYADSGWSMSVFDSEGNKTYPSSNPDITPIELIGKGSTVAFAVSCGSIWVVDGKWGPNFQLVQAVVMESKTSDDFVNGGCIMPNMFKTVQHVSSPVPATIHTPAPTPAPVKPAAPVTQVEESDDEDATPAPAPAVKAPEPAAPVVQAPEPIVEPAVEQPAATAAPTRKAPVRKPIKAAS
jgi:hypothetical protein